MRDTAGPVGQAGRRRRSCCSMWTGTLLMGKNTHARVMKGALQEVLGRPITVMIGVMSGRTDRHIITNVLREMGYTSAEIAQRFDEIIEKMTEAFRRESLANYRLLPVSPLCSMSWRRDPTRSWHRDRKSKRSPA